MGVKLAFRLQKIEQVEDKTIVLRYNRQDAVQRVYAPQGLIGLLAGDLEGPPNFINIDLDAAFFRKIEIDVDAPVDFGRVGLLAADLELEYGDPREPAELKRKDLRFERGGGTEAHHAFFLNEDLDLDYRAKLQYHFDPLSGWEGSRLSYDSAGRDHARPNAVGQSLRPLRLPGDHGDPGRPRPRHDPAHRGHAALRRRHLEQGDDADRPAGFAAADLAAAARRPGAARLLRRAAPPPRGRLGARRSAGGAAGDHGDGERSVRRPADRGVLPELRPTGIELLIVDVTYEDRANEYVREERLEFRGSALQSQRLRIARYDSSRKEFSFRLTKLAQDHSVKRLLPVDSSETIVFLGEHLST